MTRKIIDIYDNYGETVSVRFNKRLKCWSVSKNRKVVAHSLILYLDNVVYHKNSISGVVVEQDTSWDIKAFSHRDGKWLLRNGDVLSQSSGGKVYFGLIGMYAADFHVQGNLLGE